MSSSKPESESLKLISQNAHKVCQKNQTTKHYTVVLKKNDYATIKNLQFGK